MKNLAIFLLFTLVAACSTGIVVHDEDRAAELIVDFLNGLKSESGTRLAYAWTDDRFKDDISLGEFKKIVALIRSKNDGADIRLSGYEIYGPVETMAVYASSVAGEGNIYYKFVLAGMKSTDYYLLNLDVKDSGFTKKGIYQEYARPVLIEGV